MYEIARNKKFKTAYKRVSRSGKFNVSRFEIILNHLREGKELPEEFYDHALKANLSGHRECHIESDLLLQYEINEEQKVILLTNIGNHANMFES